jgi:hypothetical protein
MVCHGRLHLVARERRRGAAGEVKQGLTGSEGPGIGDLVHPALDVNTGAKRRGDVGAVCFVEYGKLHACSSLVQNAGIHGVGYAETGIAGCIKTADFRIMELLFQHT